MSSINNKFFNQYSLSKTVCFKLIPSTETINNIEKNGFLDRDFQRYNNYKVIKKLLDDFHRSFIENKLNNIKLDVEKLYALSVEFRNNKKIKDELKEERTKLKNNIINIFKEDDNFKYLFTEKIIKIVDDNTNYQFTDILNIFNGMTGYFSKYNTARETIYNNSIPNRIIEENFEIFVNNILKFNKLFLKYPEFKEKLKSYITNMVDYDIIDNILDYNKYDNFITQSNIDVYNNNISYINQLTNECFQKYEIDTKFKFSTLNKQILSDTISSFVIEKFDNLDDTINSIKSFIQDIRKDNLFNSINELVDSLYDYDIKKIYISSNHINTISNILFKDYNHVKSLLIDYADDNIKNQKNRNKFIDSDYFTVELLDNLIKDKKIKDSLLFNFDEINHSIDNFLTINDYSDEKNIIVIKNMFDNIKNCKRIFNILKCNEEFDKDVSFYDEYQKINNYFILFTKLYNQVRNFFTQKNRNSKKVILKFDNSIFGNGLAYTKENEYRTFIFQHDNDYYMGIMNKNNMPKFVESKDKNVVKKYMFQNFGDLRKMIPKCCFTKEVKEYFKNSSDDVIINKDTFKTCFYITKKIYDIYTSGSYKTNDEDKNSYIDFVKSFLNTYRTTKDYFDFSELKSADQYSTYDDFLEDVKIRCYSINSINVSFEDIKQMELNNQLFVFQIYSKDFSKNRKLNSNKNIHTLLFEEIFSDENKKKCFPFRLNGGFEMFFRKKCIDNKIVHKRGEKLLNKTDLNGNRIPNDIYMELLKFVNGKLDKDLSNEALEYLSIIKINEAHFDIIKDKRYTLDQFEIHFPMTLNALCDNKISAKDFNERINEYVTKNHSNIIGIDRGERNLLTYTVIDGNTGKEIEHGIFDKINGIDYNKLLTVRSNDRKKSRQNWTEIEQIKGLKSGYLSYVIHEICNLIVKYDAVICLERLNSKMKRSRVKIEKQIYDAFEKSLINKLSYMIYDKSKSIFDIGQLVYIPKDKGSMNDCYQNGIIYFVDPSYTSKIDPTTGFANVFRISEITNNKKKIEFFKSFDYIIFDGNNFEFSFDYNNFNTWKTYSDGKFIVNSCGDRIKKFKNQNGYFEYKTIYPTNELKSVLSEINYNIEEDLKLKIIENEQLCSKVFDIFRYIITLRNTDNNNDYIISPVKNSNNEYFDTRRLKDSNADTIASFNIATKGFLYINQKTLKNDDYLNHLKK